MLTDEQKAEIIALIKEAMPPAPADPPAPDPLKAENERLKNQIDVLTKLIASAGVANPGGEDKAKKEITDKFKNLIQNL